MPASPTPPDQLLRLLPDVVVQTDAQWRVTFLNPAWQAITGHPLASSLGQSLLDFVHPDDREQVTSTYQHSVDTREAYERVHRLRMPDGRVKHLHVRGEFEREDGQLIRSVGMVVDETDLVEAQRERDRLASVMETSTDIVSMADPQGRVAAGSGACDLFIHPGFRFKADETEVVTDDATEVVTLLGVDSHGVIDCADIEFDVFDDHRSAVQFDIPCAVAGERGRSDGSRCQRHANDEFPHYSIPLFSEFEPSSGSISNFSPHGWQAGFSTELLQISIGLGACPE